MLNQRAIERHRRTEVMSEANLIRTRLEGNINGNIQLVRGLVSTIATEPDMTQDRFAELVGSLLKNRSQLRNIAGAPNLIISLMYPLEGNERAIGLDYRRNQAQRDAALKARDLNELILAGPVNLVQGGQGFIGRLPVFVDGPDGTRTFWGIVSAVVDVERLYRDSGLLDVNLPIDIALFGKDGLGPDGQQFYGPDVRMSDPVNVEISLPWGSWMLMAAPKGGWAAPAAEIWWMRLAILIAGILILVPILVTGRLIEERQRHASEARRRKAQLMRLSRRLELALDASKVGVWELDLVTGKLVWDARMNELYGYPNDDGERTYKHWRDALHPDDVAKAEQEFRKAIDVKGRYYSNFRVRHPGGDIRNIRAIGAVYEESDGSSRIVGVNWDVTADVALNEDLRRAKKLSDARNAELEAAKAHIEYNSLHDPLTNLPNRRYLDNELSRVGGAYSSNSAMLHIDLDRFKQINDTHGHSAGDAVLVHASKVLTSNITESDFVARIGGDEFVIFCRTAENKEYPIELAERIIDEMKRPISHDGHQCRVGVSVGVARNEENLFTPHQLLINADIALYRAKNLGRNRYEVFTPLLQIETIRNKRIADEILYGIERNEFVAYFQPQFDAQSLDLVGVEALVRWHHPTEGVLAPDYFMKIAEELHVISQIDRSVLLQSTRLFNMWKVAGMTLPKVSVNVSSKRLHDEGLIEEIKGIEFEPGTVSFELVESIFLDDCNDVVKSNIDQIKELGIDIEVDDFGTGHASIVSLLQLKPRRLKIDRQFVAPIVSSSAQQNLVASIIDIGRSFNIEVVAEGVETMEHASILRDLGCSILQGYAFAPAMLPDDLIRMLRVKKPVHAS
ncbi:EAL domain-containing protein [Nitratireductor sp. XY-223]|uniref:bifunctional diguanylate cyclase/phosphodiesterase n=1 Tax=Nitratireductor sp. XY-223 TaxID=2561926 RepID=UPI001FF050B1|nr:EAL domain-containing protein [Nitratireductor sp. XY-223]